METRNLKIANAVLFFQKHTRKLTKTKLFKLLYYLDFIHLKKYGYIVTGFQYQAWKYGPVPSELYEMISQDKFPEEIRNAISFETVTTSDGNEIIIIRPHCDYDLDWFTPNEISVLKEVAEIFDEYNSEVMIESTHAINEPWAKTMKTKGMYSDIDFTLVFDEKDKNRDELEERLKLQLYYGLI